MDAQAIALASVPVLCIDTCSILDIMRDPARETALPHDRQAAIDLVMAAEAGLLVCLMAEQVAVEFATHDQPVQEEAERSLQKMRIQIERVNEITAIYGAPGNISLTHLDDHVVRARKVVERWLAQVKKVTPSAPVFSKAFARVNGGLAPARRGKDSSKDCLVYETYIEACNKLRSAGLAKPIIFLSSNVNEYLTENRILKSEIAAEFDQLGLRYAPNMSAAKHALGF